MSVWFKSRSANPAAAGVVRLANLDQINWRNAANNADNILTVDGSDELTYNGTKVAVITDIPVDSVHGRTGAVVSDTNDYSWAQIDKTVSDLADITTKSHTSLTDVGTNTHAQIDTHISDTTNPHSVTAAQVGLGNVDNTSDLTKDAATATLTNKTIDADNNTITNIGTTELEDDISFPGEGAIGLPDGTTAQRPGAPANGMMRYNTDDASFEGYADGAWGAIGGGGLEIVNVNDTNSPVTAEIGKQYQVDTGAGVVVINLPDLSTLSASEQPTAVISVVDCGSNAAVNNITVNAFAGDSIDFQDDTNDTSLVIDMQGQSVGFGRVDDTTWCQVSGLQPSAVGSVLTNSGDLLSHDGTGSNRVAVGTTGQILTSNGTDIVWEDAASGSGKNYVQNPNAGADATTGVTSTTVGTWTIARTTTASELPEETLGTAFKISGSGLTAGDTVEWAIAATGIDDSDGGRFGRARVAVKDISTTINGEYSIQVYDVTNSVYVGDEDTITGTGTYYLDVPLIAANDYEFHLKAETASPTNIGLSSITIEPVSQTVAGVVSKWEAYTPVITGMGTVTNLDAQWRQVGQNIEGELRFTGGTNTTTPQIPLPNGYTISYIDAESSNYRLVGSWTDSTASNTEYKHVLAKHGDTYVTLNREGSGQDRLVPRAHNLSTDTQSLRFSVPVAELANAHTPTASDVQYENVKCKFFLNSGTISAGVAIPYNTVDSDHTVGSWPVSSGVITIPADGTYKFDFAFSRTSGLVPDGIVDLEVGGTVRRRIAQVGGAAGTQSVYGSTAEKLSAGDTIEIVYDQSQTSINTTQSVSWLTIERIPDYSARKASLPFDEFQTKRLTSDVTNDGAISALTFNNLTIGKTYSLRGSIYFKVNTSGTNEFAAVNVTHDSVVIQIAVFRIGLKSGSLDYCASPINVDFVATADTVTFVGQSLSSSSSVEGTDTGATHVTIIEKNTTIATTKFT
jgi:hypothetical protein